MKKLIIFFSLCAVQWGHAQDVFISTGKIEFEKKMSLHKIMDARSDGPDDSWVETLKKNTPSHMSCYFDLYFNGTKTLYKPGREDVSAQKVQDWIKGPAGENIVYSDLEERKSVSSKAIFGTAYTIEDSIRNIKWQLTADTRTIAGLECRKATGIIMDSVYVFAFYTDQILTCGGPESFTGLPGMILGIAIPRLNTTWFATKLTLQEVTPEQLTFPKGKKTKVVDNKALFTQLTTSLKGWSNGGENMWRIML